jgi:predicted metal-dependent HD superfamily phosphohydrolase
VINRWNNLWKSLGIANNGEDLFYQLINAYNEKNRAYHNINHIKLCLNEFDQVKERLKNPTEVELAIWFHDVIYDPKLSNNEEESAKLAVLMLDNYEATCIRIDIVKDLILATKHDKSINTPDSEYLVDIDISIFGYPPKIYMDYEKNIRKEYEWVPEAIYRKKRKELLISFLSRGKIYYTNFFSNKYELQSRSNLKAAIKSL